MFISLMRHGQTAFNLQKRFQGHTDTALDTHGRDQIVKAAAEFRGTIEPHFLKQGQTLFFCSDLGRAIESLDLFCDVWANKPMTTKTNLLREFDVGLFAGKTFDELEIEKPKETQAFLDAYDKEPLHTPYPGGGESVAMVRARLLAFWQNYLIQYGELSPSSFNLSRSPIQEPPLDHEVWVFIMAHGGCLAIFETLLTGNQSPARFKNAELRTFRSNVK